MTLTTRFSDVISCVTRRHNCSFVTGEHLADGNMGGIIGGAGGEAGGGVGGRRRNVTEEVISEATGSSGPAILSSVRKTSKRTKRPSHFCDSARRRFCGSKEGGDSHGLTRGSQKPKAHMEPCLGTLDLISLGVGSCLGTGMYLTTGLVAATMAGPSAIISILLAGLASGLTGLCYAELAGRCPNTSGSAYMYAYVTVGELVAFVIGWGLVVEYVIGTAAGAVALSETIDSLCGGFLSTYTVIVAGALGLPKLDLVAAVVCTVLTLLLASGVQMSAKVNNILNLVNIAVLLFFVVASLWLGSARNWVAGGFFPFGVTGVVRSIPTCYYAYIGFDSVAAAGEEARNPTTTIPRSLLISILFNCLAYLVVTLALTFDLPFYLLRPFTAVMDVMGQLKFTPGQYVVAAGAVSGEFAATFGSMFPLPRVLAAMASDGLIFRPLGKICPKRHTPLRATLLSGLVAVTMSTFFDLKILIELVLIGTLLAYILVTFALLYMRYVPSERKPNWVSGADLGSKALYDLSTGPTTAVDDASEKEGSIELKEININGSTAAAAAATTPNNTPHEIPRKLPQQSRSRGALGASRDVTSATFHTSVPPCDIQPQLPSGFSLETSASTLTSPDSIGLLHMPASSKPASSAVPKPGLHKLTSVEESDNEEGSVPSDCEDTVLLFQKPVAPHSSLSTDRTGKPCRTTARQHKDDAPKRASKREKRQPRVLFDLFQGQGQASRYSVPLWIKVVTDMVDHVSASPARVLSLLCVIYLLIVALCLAVSNLWLSMAAGNVLSLGLLGVLSAIFIVLVGAVCLLPQTAAGDSFHAPLVPALPVFVAIINIYLISTLSALTWLMFTAWMGVGLLVYFFYGIRHSQAGRPHYTEVVLLTEDDDNDVDNDDCFSVEEETSLIHE